KCSAWSPRSAISTTLPAWVRAFATHSHSSGWSSTSRILMLSPRSARGGAIPPAGLIARDCSRSGQRKQIERLFVSNRLQPGAASPGQTRELQSQGGDTMHKRPINLAILACFGCLALSAPAYAASLDDLQAEIQAQKARLEKLEELLQATAATAATATKKAEQATKAVAEAPVAAKS